MRQKHLSPRDKSRLVRAAVDARRRAYCPYSEFAVGAAVLTSKGRIYSGCNIENCSYGLTVCAERVALWKAVSEGATQFRALAVAATSAGAIVTPCGACLQVMAEFAPQLRVIFVNAGNPRRVFEADLTDLLPHRFRLKT